jgi:hypothetical protein
MSIQFFSIFKALFVTMEQQFELLFIKPLERLTK